MQVLEEFIPHKEWHEYLLDKNEQTSERQNIHNVNPEDNFTKELSTDSLDVIELVIKFEEGFEIDSNHGINREIFTLQDAVDYMEGLINMSESISPLDIL